MSFSGGSDLITPNTDKNKEQFFSLFKDKKINEGFVSGRSEGIKCLLTLLVSWCPTGFPPCPILAPRIPGQPHSPARQPSQQHTNTGLKSAGTARQ